MPLSTEFIEPQPGPPDGSEKPGTKRYRPAERPQEKFERAERLQASTFAEHQQTNTFRRAPSGED
ncbi:MAG: hypothetical protein CL931_10675 [Deltaproteobacteria bacterium]|nr:hypothetical protein [Deltaproteobacteria bacterium]